MGIRALGAFERALLLCDQYSAFNIILAVQIEGVLEPGVVGHALEVIQARHPLLQAGIGWEQGQPFFSALPDAATPFHWEDRLDDLQWFKAAQSEMGSRLNSAQGPLFDCRYLYGEGRSEIILKFHHSICDGVAVENFTHELLECCAKIAAGEQPIALPRLEVSPPVDALFPPGYQGFRRAGRVAGYALRQLADEAAYRWHSRGKRIPPLRGASELKIHTAHISEKTTSSLAARAREHGVTLAIVLNAAVLRAVNHHLYLDEPGPRRTFVFANLRPFTLPPLPDQSFGCALSMLRYTVAITREATVWEVAADLQSQVSASFKRGDKFSASLMSEPLVKMVTSWKGSRMATSALSYTAIRSIRPQYGAFKVTGLYGIAPSLDLGPECSAMVTLFNGQLWWGFTYFSGDMTEEQAMQISEEIFAILEAAGRNA